MAERTQTDAQQEREKYVMAFNKTMIDIWKERLTLLDVRTPIVCFIRLLPYPCVTTDASLRCSSPKSSLSTVFGKTMG